MRLTRADMARLDVAQRPLDALAELDLTTPVGGAAGLLLSVLGLRELARLPRRLRRLVKRHHAPDVEGHAAVLRRGAREFWAAAGADNDGELLRWLEDGTLDTDDVLAAHAAAAPDDLHEFAAELGRRGGGAS